MYEGSKLLLDESPLLILPSLAQKIGLNEAIILQQVHYWVLLNKKTDKNFKDGYHWTYNSYEAWQNQFPFWSISTIRRIITSLKSKGILITGNYNKLGIDNTTWYRINYQKLMLNTPNFPYVQNEQTTCSKWTSEVVNMDRAIPETNTETNKTDIDRYFDYLLTSPTQKYTVKDVYNYYFAVYYSKNGKEHEEPIPDLLTHLSKIIDMDGTDWIAKIDEYFNRGGGTFEEFVKSL